MVKRKRTGDSGNDTKVAAIVLGFFVLGLILFVSFSKHKETRKVQAPVRQVVQVSAPVENNQPVESAPPEENVEPESFESAPGTTGGGKIAFIIDDWGQSTVNCKYLKEIPEPLAVSILPGLRHTKDVANCARLYHKLTMLHLPLEALYNNDYYPKNYIIKTTMAPDLVARIVDQDLNQLPMIEGVNNHMGSKATADRSLMKIILKKLKKRRLFFFDSMTSSHSVSAEMAEEMGLSYGKRDVFLDNKSDREAMIKQFVILAKKAKHKGYAVAITHDRPLSMLVLKEEIPWLEKQGCKIVSIKDLLRNK